MVTEIVGFFRESLVFSIFTRCHPEGRTRDLGGEYAILSLFDSSCIPLIGEVFSYSDTSHTLIDPLLAISFCFIGLCHSLHSELRIFDLLYSLISDLCEPSFEWFCFRRWDRLDDTEECLSIGTIREILLPIRCYEFQSVTICHDLTSFLLKSIL